MTGAKVVGVIDELDKGKKVRIFKKKRRKQYRRTKGHRSLLDARPHHRHSGVSDGNKKRTGHLS